MSIKTLKCQDVSLQFECCDTQNNSILVFVSKNLLIKCQVSSWLDGDQILGLMELTLQFAPVGILSGDRPMVCGPSFEEYDGSKGIKKRSGLDCGNDGSWGGGIFCDTPHG